MGLMQRLGNSLRERTRPRGEQRIFRDAIEQVVEKIDPRLHLVKGYQKKLRAPVAASLHYASAIVDGLPPAREISSQTWNTDPTVHAFFSSIETLKRTVSRSQALRDFLESPQGCEVDHVFAVLTMTKRETKRFGTQLQGDSLQKEVLQTSVGFVDHLLDIPGATEADVRASMKQVAFEEIVLHALDSIASVKTLKSDLEKERAMLQMRYRLLQGESAERESVFGTGTKRSEDLRTIEEKLAENNRQLREMFGSFSTLEDYLERVKTILEQPQDHLRLSPTGVRLNRMNIVVAEGDRRGNDIDLVEATIVNRPRRVVLIVKYPRKEFLPKPDFLKMARRYLG